MRKITMSIVSILALSGMAFAGGDIGKQVVVAEEEIVVIPTVDDSSFYVGIGYSYMNMNDKGDFGEVVSFSGEEDLNGNALTVLAGYNFNKYIAVEGRYSITLGDMTAELWDGDEMDIDAELSNIALYLKPMYPVGGLTLYGLLGYGQVTLESPITSTEFSESGFQWGLGASYAVTEDVGVFVDYTRLYDDKGFDGVSLENDFIVDSINVGVTYTF